MPVSFQSTLPIELQARILATERQRRECEALGAERDARALSERAKLDGDWIGIGHKLGSDAEEARQYVLQQVNLSEVAPPPVLPAAVKEEVSSQHAQTRAVFEICKAKGIKHMETHHPHCRIIRPVTIALLSPAELAELVRKRLERLGASIPVHKRPSTRKSERLAHRLVHFCRGNELVDKQDYSSAIADYNISLAQIPEDPYALLNRGNCFKAMRQWELAMHDYSAAIAAAKPITDKRMQLLLAYAHNNLGALHHDLDDYALAFAEYTTALAFNPGCHIAWKNRANIYHITAEPSPDPQQPAPQHKLIFSDCLTAMDQDWHEEKGFTRGSIDFTVEVRKINATYAAYIVVDLVRLPAPLPTNELASRRSTATPSARPASLNANSAVSS